MATSPQPAGAFIGGAESATYDVFGSPHSLNPIAQTPELALPVPLAAVEPAAYNAPPPVGSYAPDATYPEFDRFPIENPPRVGHKDLADYKNAERIPRRLRIQCGHFGKPAPCLKAHDPSKHRQPKVLASATFKRQATERDTDRDYKARKEKDKAAREKREHHRREAEVKNRDNNGGKTGDKTRD
eukprot:jgi/Tetstr1/455661/TSEL_042472.t1